MFGALMDLGPFADSISLTRASGGSGGSVTIKPNFISELQIYRGEQLSTSPDSLIGSLCAKIDQLESRIIELEKKIPKQQEELHPGYNSSFVLKV